MKKLLEIKENFERNEKERYRKPYEPQDNDQVEGVKHDKAKRDWALVPWREMGQVVDVLDLGCRKYSADNWMHVPGAERRYFAAAMRHLTARRTGEINDPETKLPHLAHCICCLLFALWLDNQKRRGHK
jgi:hypothetical protein